MSRFTDGVAHFLWSIAENPNRQGLKDTPERLEAALVEATKGNDIDPASVMKWFEDGGEKSDGLIVVRDIQFYSTCEHHLLPFFGVVHVGYVANGRVLGLSKFARLVEVFAKRLQVQERMTSQIADALNNSTGAPLGVGVVIEARHTCMESRGVRQIGAMTLTSALRGCVLTEASCKAEFMTLTRPR